MINLQNKTAVKVTKKVKYAMALYHKINGTRSTCYMENFMLFSKSAHLLDYAALLIMQLYINLEDNHEGNEKPHKKQNKASTKTARTKKGIFLFFGSFNVYSWCIVVHINFNVIGESKSNYGILSIVGNGSINLAGIYEFIDFITLPGILNYNCINTMRLPCM